MLWAPRPPQNKVQLFWERPPACINFTSTKLRGPPGHSKIAFSYFAMAGGRVMILRCNICDRPVSITKYKYQKSRWGVTLTISFSLYTIYITLCAKPIGHSPPKDEITRVIVQKAPPSPPQGKNVHGPPQRFLYSSVEDDFGFNLRNHAASLFFRWAFSHSLTNSLVCRNYGAIYQENVSAYFRYIV